MSAPAPSWIEPLRHALEAADADLIAAYCFGSLARGEARAGSDLDLAVLFAVDPTLVREILEHRLDDLLAFVSAIRARLVP